MDTPNCNFPSSNPYGIPDLLPDLAADYIDLPLQPWGGTTPHWRPARQRHFPGTWHFYVEDTKFNALFREPDRPLVSPSPTFCELNYSLGDSSPRWIVLERTGRKRWVSRYWQSRGRRIMVDLNVPAIHQEDNLIGVPNGWRAYSTRAADKDLADLQSQHAAACARAGSQNLIMIVIGGGEKVRSFCAQNRLEWHPAHVNQIKDGTDNNTMRNLEVRNG